jgi:transcription elongation factor SPT5
MPGIQVQTVDGITGVIVSVGYDGICVVDIPNGGRRNILTTALQPVRPSKKGTKIRVIAGEHKGSTGEVAGIDGPDRIVKLNDGSDVKIMHFTLLATLHT